MRIVCFVPKASSDAAPRLGALLPDDVHVLDFPAAIKAGAAEPLLAWYDLDGPYLAQARALVRISAPIPSTAPPGCRRAPWCRSPTSDCSHRCRVPAS